MIMRSFLLVCLLTSTASAWTMTGSSVSGFGGAVLLSRCPTTDVVASSNAGSASTGLTMKKGKSKIPREMRATYEKQKEMAAMRTEMENNSKPGGDGMPIFNLFVRTPKGNMWYPCGSFKGDQRSAALAKNWCDDGILAGISKKQMDEGIAGSLYRDLGQLKETIFRAYPQLRKSRDNLEFGYKLGYEGLSEEQQKEVMPIEPKEPKGIMDNIKGMFNM